MSRVRDAFRLYRRLVGASIRSQMQYRAAFVFQMLGLFLTTVIEVVAIWALFDRFKGLGGWTLPEVALLYGMVHIGFSLTDMTARGFDVFAGLVKSGGFDLLLVRPRGTILQLAGSQLELRRLGRTAQGAMVLAWSVARLGLHWGVVDLLTLAGAMLGAAALFYGLTILQATMCFWTVESLEMFNILTYGGVEASEYPVSVFRRWLQVGFIWIVPVAAVTYFPALALLGRADPLGSSRLFQRCAPLLGVVFLAGSLRVWRLGVRHYRSTGS